MKRSNVIALVVGLVLVGLVAYFVMSKSGAPRMAGASAKLPCLANNHCPMGQKCSNGFCGEGFVGPIGPSTDASSCTAKECNGINAACARKEVPCPEGTFCQNNSCINVAPQDQGEAYKQIGMLLD